MCYQLSEYHIARSGWQRRLHIGGKIFVGSQVIESSTDLVLKSAMHCIFSILNLTYAVTYYFCFSFVPAVTLKVYFAFLCITKLYTFTFLIDRSGQNN